MHTAIRGLLSDMELEHGLGHTLRTGRASVKVPKRQVADDGVQGSKLVVLVGAGPHWQVELLSLLSSQGYVTRRVEQLDAVAPLIASGAVQAILVAARPFAASDLVLLGRIREVSPGTSIVVVTSTPTDPDLKRAFESGATAFLSWPASLEALRHAIERGLPSSGGAAL